MTKNGFTLIEMLVVLSVVSSLLVLALPMQMSLIKKLEEEQFLNQFQEDVLLVQNQASFYSNEKMYIRFYADHYKVIRGIRTTFAERPYPEGWSFSGSNQQIRFKETGTIQGAGTILMHRDGERIAFVFPLGKGRFYID